MEHTHPSIGAVAARNIKLELVDRNISKNALATKAGIPATTFTRNLDRPENFTLKHLADIATALGVKFTDLLKDAA